MPREILTITVGQAGNQIGWRFWDMVVREHAALSKPGVFDDGMSTFFRNERDLDDDSGPLVGRAAKRISSLSQIGASSSMALPDSLFSESPLGCLKARSILVDMEEGVVNQVLKSPMGELFDRSQLLTDVSGAGNNWAHGFYGYGPRYQESVMEKVRLSLEACDSPQSFFMITSTGGGTGSGLGSFILEQLADCYPELYRFNAAVFPSDDDDVVTSPYNFCLAFDKLVQHSDCVLPLENQALLDVSAAVEAGLRKLARSGGYGSSGGMGGGGGRESTGSSAFAEARMSALTFVPPPPLRPSKLAFAPVTSASLSGGRSFAAAASSSSSSSSSSSAASVVSASTNRRAGGPAPLPARPQATDSPAKRERDVEMLMPSSARDAGDDVEGSEAQTLAHQQRSSIGGRKRVAALGLGKAAVGILPGMATTSSSSTATRRGPAAVTAAMKSQTKAPAAQRAGQKEQAIDKAEEEEEDEATVLQKSLLAADAAIARALAVANDPLNAGAATGKSSAASSAVKGQNAAATAGTQLQPKQLSSSRPGAGRAVGPASKMATTGVAGALGARKPAVPTQQPTRTTTVAATSASSAVALKAGLVSAPATGPASAGRAPAAVAAFAAVAAAAAPAQPRATANYGDAEGEDEGRGERERRLARAQHGQRRDETDEPSWERDHQSRRHHDQEAEEEGEGEGEEDRDNFSSSSSSFRPAAASTATGRKGTAFDAMNNLAAHLLTNLTASMRFEGPHNVDLNEIASTLVPFPRMHVLQAAISPLFVPPGELAASSSSGSAGQQKAIDAMFSSAYHKDLQLIRGDPRRSVHLACGLFARGPNIKITDVTRNVERLKREITMVGWNPDGFKTGICAARPLFRPYSLLSLSNNTSIVPTLTKAHNRFTHLFRVRAHLFHYSAFMGGDRGAEEEFVAAANSLGNMISSYNEMESDELGSNGGNGGNGGTGAGDGGDDYGYGDDEYDDEYEERVEVAGGSAEAAGY